jgi:hypothetical protein
MHGVGPGLLPTMPHVTLAWPKLELGSQASNDGAPSPGRSDGATSPAEIGDVCSAAASAGVKAAATGEQRREWRPVGFSLDAKPGGAILPDHLGGQAHVGSGCDRRAPREAQRGQASSPHSTLANGDTSHPPHIQASARGTDAERASQEVDRPVWGRGGNHGPLM